MNRRALAAGSALGLALVAASAAHAQVAYDFNLPSQALADSLRAVGSRGGVNVAFDPAAVRGKTAPALRGTFAPQAALERLAAGSGLVVRVTAGGSFLVEAPASPPSQAAPNAGAADLDEVLVTGTRTRGAPVTSPVTKLSQRDIRNTGYATIGQVLQSLPQVFSGGQSPTNIGGKGISDEGGPTFSTLPNIRGLGADSTLSLVDGRRLAFDSFSAGSDISIIPAAAVERIDVVTDGASAIYGSDAVAGVVNVILRDRFEGAESTARLGGTSDGGHTEQTYSQVLGRNWEGGNITVAAQSYLASPLNARDRSFAVGAGQDFQIAPRQQDINLFAAAHQDLTDSLSLYARILAARRRTDSNLSQPQFAQNANEDLSEDAELIGLKASLPQGWRADLSGNVGGSYSHYRTSGSSSEKNHLGGVDLDLEGPLFRTAAGEVRLALGGGYRHESLAVSSPLAGQWGREIEYAYGEATAPLVTPDSRRTGLVRLQANAALRYERYSDSGQSTTPKVGLLYSPLEGLDLKASWGRSFRAPTLDEMHAGIFTSLYPGVLFGPASAGSTVLIYTGSNTDLGPQKATTFTAGFDVSPSRLGGVELHVNYFRIDYSDRIALPITNLVLALRDPTYAPFVTRSPSPELLAALIGKSQRFFNNSGKPYDPSIVTAVLRDYYQNVSSQKADGWDVAATYERSTRMGDFRLAAAGTWIHLEQNILPGSPTQGISGTLYNVPRFKARASLGWTYGDLFGQLSLNHINGESDPAGGPHIDGWDTVDLLFRASSSATDGPLKGTSVEFSVLNLFNTDPPFVDPRINIYTGLAYDPANATPYGRSASVTLRKRW